MLSEERGLLLHDLMTRGYQLSQKEQDDLQNWYAHQDTMEVQEVGVASRHNLKPNLQFKIDQCLNQIKVICNNIQSTNKTNELIRQENKRVRKQVEQLLSDSY